MHLKKTQVKHLEFEYKENLHCSVEHKEEEEDETHPNDVRHRSGGPGGWDDTGYRIVESLVKNLGSRKIC